MGADQIPEADKIPEADRIPEVDNTLEMDRIPKIDKFSFRPFQAYIIPERAGPLERDK